MSNTTLTADVIAREAVMILENNCVMANLVFRGYEEEFANTVNGYKVGSTVSIRRPTDFTVRSGAVAAIQDVVEGKFSITVDTQEGVDFRFTSSDLSLKIGDLSERVIRPAMIQIGNSIDRKLTALYKDVWSWVGTPGQVVNSFADFAKAPERLDLLGVPMDGRAAVLSPTDEYGMLGSQTGLFIQDAARAAYREGSLGRISSVDTYSSQNILTHTTGDRDDTTPVTKAAGTGVLSTTWAASKNTGTMALSTSGWNAGGTILKGDVFTIDTVFAVNPVTKATLPFLQPFVVTADVTADGNTALETTVTISPPIIASGAFQTVSNAPVAGKAIVNIGGAATGYAQNLVFTKNAFSLVMVPMERPPGATEVARRSYKGFSVRVIPYYDGINDISSWRLDVLYGVKTIDARQAVRLSGTS